MSKRNTAMQEQEPASPAHRKLRTMERRPYDTFKQTAETLGLEGPDLSELLGYSRHAYNSWRENGYMPAVAALACKALLAEYGTQESNITNMPDSIFLVRVPADTKPAFTSVMRGLVNTKITEI